MKCEVREIREGDLPYLSKNLRSADAREIFAASGSTDFQSALRLSVDNSEEALAGSLKGGAAEVLYGISPYSPRAYLIWALASPEIANNKMVFLRTSRAVLKRWFEERPNAEYFINFVHGQNDLHQKWLKWMGADLYPATPVGPRGEDFRPFMISRKKYHV